MPPIVAPENRPATSNGSRITPGRTEPANPRSVSLTLAYRSASQCWYLGGAHSEQHHLSGRAGGRRSVHPFVSRPALIGAGIPGRSFPADPRGRPIMPTIASDPGATPATAAAAASLPSAVDWGAIIAGGVLAVAISFILLTFGSAIGLSLTSPYDGEGRSLAFLGAASGLWVVWVQVSSFMAGASPAGRLRRRLPDATAHEVEVRDGSHGLLVWALGVLVGAMLAASVATGVANTAASAVSTATQAVGSGVTQLAQN